MKKPFAYLIYRLIMVLFSPIVLIWLMKEAKQINNWSWLLQKLGKTPPITVDIWIHCASVGEVNAATPLIQACLAKQHKIHITCFTPTGLLQIKRRFPESNNLSCSALPIDWHWCISRFLQQMQCTQLWIVETELWPTLILKARQSDIKLFLINGRLSQKTLTAPSWWQHLLAGLLNQHFEQCLLRNERDMTDFIKLGVTPAKLVIAGNLKYCDVAPAHSPKLIDQPYVLFASTHEPEEIKLALAWRQHPRLPKLVIVPRHPKRRHQLAKTFSAENIPFQLRSETKDVNTQGILISDTFGELSSWMAHAELVIMGGSFVNKGGQNPLEASKLGKFVLCGPDMRDFLSETEYLDQIGLLKQAQDINMLLDMVVSYLSTTAVTQHNKTDIAPLIQKQQDILDAYLSILCKDPT